MNNTLRKILNAVLPSTKYQYRNLPYRDSFSENPRWVYVSGIDCIKGGGGILEWCYDLEDADTRIFLMKQDRFRFKNLRIYFNPESYTEPHKPLSEWIGL